MKVRNTILVAGAIALILGGFGAFAEEAAVAPAADCQAQLPLVAMEAAPSCQGDQPPAQTPAFLEPGAGENMVFLGTCSGEQCGCFDPPCSEQCSVGDQACMSACRQEQKQCAICCCCTSSCPLYC